MTKVLVVEDMDALREEIMDTLRFEGYEVLGAENGLVGVALATEHLPDIILCDVMMPQMDGYETLKVLRQQPATAMIPFIFLTAKADKQDMRHGMELGADDYLTKPFTVAELLGAIQGRLQKAQCWKKYAQEMGQDNNSAYKRNEFYQLLNSLIPVVGNKGLALLLLEIDQLPLIHGALGRDIGNELLQAVGERLQFLLPADYPMVQLGGEEFAIAAPKLADRQQVQEFAQRLIHHLGRGYTIYGNEIFITTSIGISLYPQDALTAEDLLKNADSALYYSKQLGHNRYQCFEPSLGVEFAERMALENSLRQGLEHGEFRLVVQPIVELSRQVVVGLEVLLRWQHRQMGTIMPNRFLPLAEETGLILDLDLWALEQAENLYNRWHLPISLNISGKHFQSDSTFANLVQHVRRYPLCLDIAEKVVMQHPVKLITHLRTLQEMGVKVAIDDFGTGFASYEILKHFPANYLKIDGSFVHHLPTDKHAVATTQSIIELANELQWEIIAQGIETKEQLALLHRLGCQYGQGYIFTSPISPDQFDVWLSSRRV
ncbi:MAG: EAL domain-containing protein [Pseudanabaenaceae cyanobacterium SKYGB_i_bin29]|nr:EAL domain-containing protein [Pseudanabaenaceae cyanobacterium SKYG29]MDW8420642.1 EAL domain-containing protein [Pseudanabaenaceae cyanobacterium SKYGB_i_bin29]